MHVEVLVVLGVLRCACVTCFSPSLRSRLLAPGQLEIFVEPPPLEEDADGRLSRALIEATGAAACVVDPVASRVPPLPRSTEVVHAFSPMVYFDDRRAPRSEARARDTDDFAARLERLEGTSRLVRIVAPLDREDDIISGVCRRSARVLTARRRSKCDVLFRVDRRRSRWSCEDVGPAGEFGGQDQHDIDSVLGADARAYWCDAAALPEAAVGEALMSTEAVFSRPTRTDARARLERCCDAEDTLYWLCDHPDGIAGSGKMLPAGARYVADVNPAGELPTLDDARALGDAGAVALVFRWHAVRSALGSAARWAPISGRARALQAAGAAALRAR